MPTHPEVFGFGNEWYQPALENAEIVELPSGNRIRMVTAPYFLATKLAAFEGRGRGDYLASHDMEDIVAVLDGRPEIVDEIERSHSALKQRLSRRFHTLLNERGFTDSLPGHLLGDAASQARLPFVMERIKAIAGM
jgi:predicted nucleotidyltransferase